MTRDVRSLLKPGLFLALLSFCLILFTYFTPPLLDDRLPALLFQGSLPGDLPVYFFRFFVSFLVLGVLPLTGGLLGLFKPADTGLRFTIRNLKPWVLLAFAGAAAAAGIISSFTSSMSAYYPYSRTIVELVGAGRHIWLLYHGILYFFLYYVPWEFFFRGLMIFPLLRFMEIPEHSWTWNNPRVLLLSCLQVAPSALLHFGHPLAESLSSVAFGFFLGWLALRTRSIIPGLIVHSLVGISMNIAILII
ncbi:MAG: CPBP family intramembrane metalloprotease [Spirochaetales bacterium]|nr:MAG: CPBP family intramembrane metalloprotease [Spirochaetales bacterium]